MEQYIEHTLLKPDALEGSIRSLVEEAETYRFLGVCVLPKWVGLAKRLSAVKVISVVGFPGGKEMGEEARILVEEGVDEIDMVANVEAIQAGNWSLVRDEIAKVVEVGVPIKVIIETGVLNDQEIREAARCVELSGAHFVKTSTGFVGGATVEAVRLIKEEVGDRIGIKASGGIKSYEQAIGLVRAGANRIGTSSGVAIMSEIY